MCVFVCLFKEAEQVAVTYLHQSETKATKNGCKTPFKVFSRVQFATVVFLLLRNDLANKSWIILFVRAPLGDALFAQLLLLFVSKKNAANKDSTSCTLEEPEDPPFSRI